jgi:hypothetical protein
LLSAVFFEHCRVIRPLVVINLKSAMQNRREFIATAGGLFVAVNKYEREDETWKPRKTMGVCADDVTTAFLRSSIAAPVATCRTGRQRASEKYEAYREAA